MTEFEESFTDFKNLAREEFLALIESDLLEVVQDRIECLAGAYPAIDIDSAIAAESFSEILQLAGVAEGRWIGDEPQEPVVPDGQVVVVPPVAPVTYRPSDAEVSFALEYVKCGNTVDFERRVRKVEIEAREQVMANHQTDLMGFTEQYRQIERSLVETARVEPDLSN